MFPRWSMLFVSLSLIYVTAATPINAVPTQNGSSNYFQNAFYSLSIRKPDNWYRLNSEELYLGFLNLYTPFKIDFTAVYDNFIQIFPQPIIPLFGFMQYPFGTINGKLNPSIIGIVMNFTQQSNIGYDCNIFIYSDQFLVGKPVLVLSKSVCSQVDIDGNRFVMQDMTLNVFGPSFIKQTQYAKRINNDYFLLVTLTYFDEQNKRELDNIMRTLTFFR